MRIRVAASLGDQSSVGESVRSCFAHVDSINRNIKNGVKAFKKKKERKKHMQFASGTCKAKR